MTISLSLKYRLIFLVAGDMLLCLTSFYVALSLRYGYPVANDIDMHNYIGMTSILILVVIFVSYISECYSREMIFRKRELLKRSPIAAVLSFVLLSSLFYMFPEVSLGRQILLFQLSSFVVLQIAWHFLFFFSNNSPRFAKRIMILGTGENAIQMAKVMKDSRSLYTFVGYVRCGSEPTDEEANSEEIIGKADELRDLAQRFGAETVVVALSERRGVFPLRDALSCKLNGVGVIDAATFYENVCGKLLLERITPSWFIFSNGFKRPFPFIVAKRFVDILLSLIGLAITIPLFPLIAIAIKIDSPGPLFFSQLRVGNRERLFKLYKFRTMKQDAEVVSGAVWATQNDPRVTRLGRFMRKTRIDEIPQLYNVLRGAMSFVGPRPERPEFVEKLKEVIPYYSRRHFVKPGVTGWAQVRYPYGASVEDAVEKLRYDLYYIKNLSPLLDTLIFFETIKVVLFGRGGR